MENSSPDFITLTPQNLAEEHLCCIIRSRKPHPGVEAKRRWLSERLKEGHVFRKLNVKGCVFIEYAPLETAWVPITGENFLYIYCLWATAPYKGKGYGRALIESCIADAREKGKSGVCILGAQKQKAWLTDQSFAKNFGFQVVDSTAGGYELLSLSFDGAAPRFTDCARASRIESRGADHLLRPAMPLCGAKHRDGPTVLRRTGRAAVPYSGRYAGTGKELTVRVQ